ncbi:hypothetical protein [Umezawaea tangerina]|uniref:Peptidase inhibitor family I36 n=1 Tax=Umezawaea tangerina TaxID=84725 RepID=A0A2T0TGP5_9PSEU|nr:hypothetical protein [Umezawaea tangerina]PRY44788.1 hypothetical protein CLV43_102353 [Umezawaea tangerina]
MTIDLMTGVERTRRGSAKRRVLRALLAIAMIVGAIGATAGTASAAQVCSGAKDANVCLAINGLGNNTFAIHVGIDAYMSGAEAQEFIDDVGDPFTVWIRGWDNGRPGEFLFALPTTLLVASDEFGLGGDFDRAVPGAWLNEDEGPDEVVAVLTLTDTDTNTVVKTYTSPVLTGDWS